MQMIDSRVDLISDRGGRFPVWPAWIALAAIVISALVMGILYTDCNPVGDTITHLKFARVLADGHIFINDPVLSIVQEGELRVLYDEVPSGSGLTLRSRKNSFILTGYPQVLAGGKCPNGQFFSFVSIGYPLVLAGLIRFFGMYSGFLVNALFVAGMLTATAWYIYISFSWEGRESSGAWCALVSVTLLLIVVPEYALLWRASRESFHIALLLLSLGLFAIGVRPDRFKFWAVGLSGFLFGYAISTLEVSVILLPVFLAVVIINRIHLGSFKRPVAGMMVFVMCMFTGIIPLLVQNFLTTGVWYKTPQSIPNLAYLFRPVSGRSKGWNLAQFSNVSLWYWRFFISHFTWFGLLLAGVAMIVRRKDSGFWIFFFFPAAVMFLFYSCYQRGHGRYFMRIAVFLTPMVVSGGLVVVSSIKRFTRRLKLKRYLRYERVFQRLQQALAVVFAAGLAFAGIQPILTHATTVVGPTRLSFSEISGLKTALEKIVPPNACILAYPHLYDILYIHVRGYSFPMSDYDKCGRLAARRLKRLVDAGIPVYYVQSPAEDGREKNHLALLKSIFDTTQVGTLALPAPNWVRFFYREGCSVYRIAPLTTRRTSFRVDIEPQQDVLLVLDLGELPEGNHTALIEMEDTWITCGPGGNFLLLSAKEKSEVIEIKITSNSLIPCCPLRARFSPGDSLVASSDLFCLFSDEFADIERKVDISDGITAISGSIKIPNWPDDPDAVMYMEIDLWGACNMERLERQVTFSREGVVLKSKSLPGGDHLHHTLRYKVGPIQNTIDNHTHTGVIKWTLTANVPEGFANSVACKKYTLFFTD